MVTFVVSKPTNKLSASRLEILYARYGANIYSLCLCLLTKEKPAEDATVETFVRFWRNANAEWDESHSVSHLRELALEACRRRIQSRWLWKLWVFSAR